MSDPTQKIRVIVSARMCAALSAMNEVKDYSRSIRAAVNVPTATIGSVIRVTFSRLESL